MSEIKISYNFEGDVALVTGAGAGIGLATAIAFAKAGAAVVLSDINEDLLIIETEKLRTAGYTVSSFKCDVADESQAAALIKHAVDTFGRLDMVFLRAVGYQQYTVIRVHSFQKIGRVLGKSKARVCN